MSEFFIDPENRERFREIESLIEANGWSVERRSVNDRVMDAGERYLRTELVLEQPAGGASE